MKTLEMLEKLLEDTRKRYVAKNWCGKDYYVYFQKKTATGGHIESDCDGYISDFILNNGTSGKGTLNLDWTEVIEPVDFDTARNQILDYHDLTFKRGNCEMSYNHSAKDVRLSWSQSDIIKNVDIVLGGKWIKQS